MTSVERRTWWAMGASMLLACASGPRPGSIAPKSLTGTVKFTVAWDADRRCPTGATPDPTAQNCPSGAADCVALSRANRNVVVFDSNDSSLDFELYFDPFKGAPIHSAGGKKSLQIDPGVPPNKTFLFYLAPAHQPTPPCQPPDPTIIIMP